MRSISANLNIMIKAAEKASKALIRDFAKIEKIKNNEFENVIKKGFNELRNKRKKALNETTNLELEKRVFLQTIDFLWRSHLQYLEHLRSVIGLRGYANKDPLEEFKKEAFKLFENLLYKIKTDFITFLNHLEVVPRSAPPEKNINNEQKNFEDSSEFPKRKMKRNEPCFCGSGKKYKHCHGAL